MAEAAAIANLEVSQGLLSVPVRNKVKVSYSKEGIVIYIPHPSTWSGMVFAQVKKWWRGFRGAVWPFPPVIVMGGIASLTAL
jgi:hypothetical protein